MSALLSFVAVGVVGVVVIAVVIGKVIAFGLAEDDPRASPSEMGLR